MDIKSEILAWARTQQGRWSNADAAKAIGRTEDYVGRATKELRARGILEREFRNSAWSYRLTEQIDAPQETGPEPEGGDFRALLRQHAELVSHIAALQGSLRDLEGRIKDAARKEG